MFRKLCNSSLILLIVLTMILPPAAALADTPQQENALIPFDVEATAAILLEAETGSVLYAKNAAEALPPASITKMMTLLLAFEALEDGRVHLEDTIITSERAWRMQGSQMFLNVGQEVSFGDLLTGISVVSANDASVAVAEHLSGSEEQFVTAMNERAAALGMENTRFENSTGWPSAGHYMSAEDIAILSREITLTQPELIKLESQLSFTFNDIRQSNRNPLLGRYSGADGLKTGWTDEARYCLAGTAVQNDTRLIAVVLGAESQATRLSITTTLLNYGFRNFALKNLLEPGETAGEVPLNKGKDRKLKVTVASPLKVMAPINETHPIELVKSIQQNPLEAPVQKGDKVGMIQVVINGSTIADGALVALEDAERANIFTRFFRSVGDFVSGLVQNILGKIL